VWFHLFIFLINNSLLITSLLTLKRLLKHFLNESIHIESGTKWWASNLLRSTLHSASLSIALLAALIILETRVRCWRNAKEDWSFFLFFHISCNLPDVSHSFKISGVIHGLFLNINQTCSGWSKIIFSYDGWKRDHQTLPYRGVVLLVTGFYFWMFFGTINIMCDELIKKKVK